MIKKDAILKLAASGMRTSAIAAKVGASDK